MWVSERQQGSNRTFMELKWVMDIVKELNIFQF